MQTSVVLIALGIVLFAITLVLFRRHAPTAGPIWKGGSGRSRIGLVAWWLSILLLAAGLVMHLRG